MQFRPFKTFMQKQIQNFCQCRECLNIISLPGKLSRCWDQERSSFLRVHAQNPTHHPWKMYHFNRIWLKLQFLTSHRFPAYLKEIRTFNNLKVFLSRASMTQKQIQKHIPIQMQMLQRSFKFLISDIFQNSFKKGRSDPEFLNWRNPIPGIMQTMEIFPCRHLLEKELYNYMASSIHSFKVQH